MSVFSHGTVLRLFPRALLLNSIPFGMHFGRATMMSFLVIALVDIYFDLAGIPLTECCLRLDSRENFGGFAPLSVCVHHRVMELDWGYVPNGTVFPT